MEFLTKISASEWLTLGPRVVGLTFIWAGGIKAVAPHTFYGHLASLSWIEQRFIRAAVNIAAALEVGWGLVLLLGIAPEITYPFSIALLAILSTISWWSVRTGKASDCGCYGGFAEPSIAQSVGLNAGFIALIAIAWIAPQPSSFELNLQFWIAVLGAVIAGVMAEAAQRYQSKNGRLLFDTNPLKSGRRWRQSWAGGNTDTRQGEAIVAFLGPDCPFCAQWVRIGNAVLQSPSLPAVIGVVAASREKLDSFVRANGIRFPVSTISQSLMGRLAQAVPTTVLVKDGRIERTWVGSAPPPEFVDRVKEAFFPEAMKDPQIPLGNQPLLSAE